MPASNPVTEYVIAPPKGLVHIDLAELWRFRDLFYIFVWRDIKVRYKQTILGAAWAIFQPLVTMVIFTVFFGRLAQIPSGGAPYPIFVYTGLLFWNYYSTALTNASNCMIENENIIKKVYFPRLILPLSTAITPVIDFLFAFLVMAGLMIYYQYVPNIWSFLVIPILLFISLVTSSGLGLLLASINVKYRDVRYILPFFIQLLLFITPVIYPADIAPDNLKWLLYINPMAGVITLARFLLIGVGSVEWDMISVSVVSSGIIFLIGLFYFRKTERFFADLL